ncbi:uncharacterized protein LOC101856391 [Aplysia californica]|uniref:Uncharacterized protein LOC101856391 n=1 Tax=Aplysia californica TaxID=6500 RepID=A0ABM0K9K3_APLCA|nr:uncharacterized protein LOC101856391 [Aplysia californica]
MDRRGARKSLKDGQVVIWSSHSHRHSIEESDITRSARRAGSQTRYSKGSWHRGDIQSSFQSKTYHDNNNITSHTKPSDRSSQVETSYLKASPSVVDSDRKLCARKGQDVEKITSHDPGFLLPQTQSERETPRRNFGPQKQGELKDGTVSSGNPRLKLLNSRSLRYLRDLDGQANETGHSAVGAGHWISSSRNRTDNTKSGLGKIKSRFGKSRSQTDRLGNSAGVFGNPLDQFRNHNQKFENRVNKLGLTVIAPVVTKRRISELATIQEGKLHSAAGGAAADGDHVTYYYSNTESLSRRQFGKTSWRSPKVVDLSHISGIGGGPSNESRSGARQWEASDRTSRLGSDLEEDRETIAVKRARNGGISYKDKAMSKKLRNQKKYYTDDLNTQSHSSVSRNREMNRENMAETPSEDGGLLMKSTERHRGSLGEESEVSSDHNIIKGGDKLALTPLHSSERSNAKTEGESGEVGGIEKGKPAESSSKRQRRVGRVDSGSWSETESLSASEQSLRLWMTSHAEEVKRRAHTTRHDSTSGLPFDSQAHVMGSLVDDDVHNFSPDDISRRSSQSKVSDVGVVCGHQVANSVLPRRRRSLVLEGEGQVVSKNSILGVPSHDPFVDNMAHISRRQSVAQLESAQGCSSNNSNANNNNNSISSSNNNKNNNNNNNSSSESPRRLSLGDISNRRKWSVSSEVDVQINRVDSSFTLRKPSSSSRFVERGTPCESLGDSVGSPPPWGVRSGNHVNGVGDDVAEISRLSRKSSSSMRVRDWCLAGTGGHVTETSQRYVRHSSSLPSIMSVVSRHPKLSETNPLTAQKHKQRLLQQLHQQQQQQHHHQQQQQQQLQLQHQWTPPPQLLKGRRRSSLSNWSLEQRGGTTWRLGRRGLDSYVTSDRRKFLRKTLSQGDFSKMLPVKSFMVRGFSFNYTIHPASVKTKKC